MIRILIILILLTGCSSKQQVLPTPIGELKTLVNIGQLLGDKKEKEDE